MNTTAMQFVNQAQDVISENITIPVKDLPAIQSAIIQTSAQAGTYFFFIGVGMTAVFAYLYFRIWKKTWGKIDREVLATHEHEQWGHWTEYMLSNLTPENIEKWKRQAQTPYSKLSEQEQNSDRDWADRLIRLISGEGK